MNGLSTHINIVLGDSCVSYLTAHCRGGLKKYYVDAALAESASAHQSAYTATYDGDFRLFDLYFIGIWSHVGHSTPIDGDNK